jgi:hypothetical protein
MKLLIEPKKPRKGIAERVPENAEKSFRSKVLAQEEPELQPASKTEGAEPGPREAEKLSPSKAPTRIGLGRRMAYRVATGMAPPAQVGKILTWYPPW